MSMTDKGSYFLATDGRRKYVIEPGTSGFVVRDAESGEQIAAIGSLSEVEDL